MDFLVGYLSFSPMLSHAFTATGRQTLESVLSGQFGTLRATLGYLVGYEACLKDVLVHCWVLQLACFTTWQNLRVTLGVRSSCYLKERKREDAALATCIRIYLQKKRKRQLIFSHPSDRAGACGSLNLIAPLRPPPPRSPLLRPPPTPCNAKRLEVFFYAIRRCMIA